MDRIHKAIIIILTTGFLLNLAVVFLTKQARNINKDVISATRTNRIPESVQIEVGNLYYNRTIEKWTNRYYKLNSNHNSEVAQFVLLNNSRLNDIIGNKKYSSLYNLLVDLKLQGYDKEEYDVVRSWINSRNFTDLDKSECLDFLDYYYLTPIIWLFNNYEIDNAVALSKQLFNRISMLSFSPLHYGDVYTNERVSKMYLVCAFLSSPKEVLSNYDFFHSAINDYILQIDNEDFKNISSEKVENNLGDYYNYLLYIYHFKKKDYHTAYDILLEISKKNHILYQLTLLQKARVIFWIKQNEELEYLGELYVIDKDEILEECVLPSFKSDIEIYFF
jgi:hypothetical protein